MKEIWYEACYRWHVWRWAVNRHKWIRTGDYKYYTKQEDHEYNFQFFKGLT